MKIEVKRLTMPIVWCKIACLYIKWTNCTFRKQNMHRKEKNDQNKMSVDRHNG